MQKNMFMARPGHFHLPTPRGILSVGFTETHYSSQYHHEWDAFDNKVGYPDAISSPLVEIAVIDYDGNFITDQFAQDFDVQNNVIGWATMEQVNAILLRLLNPMDT